MNKKELLKYIWNEYDTYKLLRWKDIETFEEWVSFHLMLTPRKDLTKWNPIGISATDIINHQKEMYWILANLKLTNNK